MAAGERARKRTRSERTVFDARDNMNWALVMERPGAAARVVYAETVKDALRLRDTISEFDRMTSDLHKLLAQWAMKHRERLSAVFTTFRDGALTFVAVQRERGYDFSLEDELTRLDLDVAKRFPELPFAVLHLPNCPPDELQSFIASDGTLTLSGLHS